MGKIIQFPSNHSDNTNGFTPEARKRWDAIPPDVRQLLAKNAYCPNCQEHKSMSNVGGSIDKGCLVLKGICDECGFEVRRLVE